MSKSKHGPTTCVLVSDNSNIDYAIKKLSRLSNAVISEHKRSTDHYEKPSSVRHQMMQSKLHKLELEKEFRNGKVFRPKKQDRR